MIVVLADDLTGAAEIGGIAWRYGLSAEIQTAFQPASDADLIVIDTNTRSCDPLAAAQRVSALAEECQRAGGTRFFKKVDSVLRGPVLSELTALLKTVGGRRVLLVPANPSLGRTIWHGNYWVKDRLLHQTEFANDPEYPANTSDVKQILLQRSEGGMETQWPVDVLSPGEPLPSHGMIVGASASVEDTRQWAGALDEGTIPAGAADFFATYLASYGYRADRKPSPELGHLDRSFFVCGSTSTAARLFCHRCESSGVPVFRMPVELFDPSLQPSEPVKKWAGAIVRALRDHPKLVVAIDQPISKTPNISQLLTDRLSMTVERILAETSVNHLFVEGGATAAALVKRLDWRQLRVTQELTPGVVCMAIEGRSHPLLTIKPGSYYWPIEVLRLG